MHVSCEHYVPLAEFAVEGVILVEDVHSSYIKGAAKLIREWNRKLSADYVDLLATSEITFG